MSIPLCLVLGVAARVRRRPDLAPPAPWVAAAAQAEIRNRLNVVRKAKKVTQAMKLIAAAKLRRAQELVFSSRPFAEGLQDVFLEVVRRVPAGDVDELEIPLLQVRDVQRVTLLVVGADRGLCGSYTPNIIRRATQRVAELRAAGLTVDLVTVGDKVTNWFQRRSAEYQVASTYASEDAIARAPQIGSELAIAFAAKETDAVEVLYTRFLSLAKTEPGTITLLPFQPTKATQPLDELWRLTARGGRLTVERDPAAPRPRLEPALLLDQDPVTIFRTLVPLYINSQVTRILQEAFAAESSIRLLSMRQATDNADELAKKLQQDYNRLRQEKITTALLENGDHTASGW